VVLLEDVEVVKRGPPPDRLDANIARLEAELEHEIRKSGCSIEQKAAVFGSALRAGVTQQATINISGIAPEFLRFVLAMARDLVREDLERGVLAALNLRVLERRAIIAALEQVGWRQDRAALLLGVSKRVLGYKVERHGITHTSWRRNTPNEIAEVVT